MRKDLTAALCTLVERKFVFARGSKRVFIQRLFVKRIDIDLTDLLQIPSEFRFTCQRTTRCAKKYALV